MECCSDLPWLAKMGAKTVSDNEGSKSMASEKAPDKQLAKSTEQYQLFEQASRPLFKKYEAAIREMRTRFEILDTDLEYRLSRNPIHHIESRIKAPKSVYDKLYRYGVPVTLKSMEENILDIAGMRVIVSYIDDVSALLKVLSLQDDLQIVKVKDYITHPKPNGYRSLHIIVKVPVYFLDRKQYVPVEIQLRTIAMDFWASLEHTLKYKQDAKVEGIDMFDELKDCSDIIQDVERRMQILMHAVQTSDVEEAASRRRAQIEEQEKVVAGVADAASGKPERAISSSTKTVTEAAVQRSISDATAVREKTE